MGNKIYRCFCGWTSTAHKNEAIKHANVTFHVVEFFRITQEGSEVFQACIEPTVTFKVTAKDVDLGYSY